MLFLLIGGICIWEIYSAGSNRIVGATRILERNKSLISLAKLSLLVTANPNQYLVCT